jgi:hypothetical protein
MEGADGKARLFGKISAGKGAKDIFSKTGGSGLVFPGRTFLLLISAFIFWSYL